MFAMVNERTAARRKRREELELACIEQGGAPTVRPRMVMNVVVGAAIRGGMGLLTVAGISRGMVDPGFGLVLVGVSALWAWLYCRRCRRGYH